MQKVSSRPDWLNYSTEGGNLVISGDSAKLITFPDGKALSSEMPRTIWRSIALLHKAAESFDGWIEFPGGKLLRSPYKSITLTVRDTTHFFDWGPFQSVVDTYLTWEGLFDTPEIVLTAVLSGVINIGQLTKEALRDLEQAVDNGLLVKYKGGPYYTPKWVYTVNWFAPKEHDA